MLFSGIVSFVADAAVVSTSIALFRHFTGFSLLRSANKIKNDKIRTGLLVYLNSGELIFNKSLEMVRNSSFKSLSSDTYNGRNITDNSNNQQPPSSSSSSSWKKF
ncbi:hypothetical protein ACTA71_009019 [Dictyostelium dimigraforme]